jgi:hypothetical protein
VLGFTARLRGGIGGRGGSGIIRNPRHLLGLVTAWLGGGRVRSGIVRYPRHGLGFVGPPR